MLISTWNHMFEEITLALADDQLVNLYFGWGEPVGSPLTHLIKWPEWMSESSCHWQLRSWFHSRGRGCSYTVCPGGIWTPGPATAGTLLPLDFVDVVKLCQAQMKSILYTVSHSTWKDRRSGLRRRRGNAKSDYMPREFAETLFQFLLGIH